MSCHKCSANLSSRIFEDGNSQCMLLDWKTFYRFGFEPTCSSVQSRVELVVVNIQKSRSLIHTCIFLYLQISPITLLLPNWLGANIIYTYMRSMACIPCTMSTIVPIQWKKNSPAKSTVRVHALLAERNVFPFSVRYRPSNNGQRQTG